MDELDPTYNKCGWNVELKGSCLTATQQTHACCRDFSVCYGAVFDSREEGLLPMVVVLECISNIEFNKEMGLSLLFLKCSLSLVS